MTDLIEARPSAAAWWVLALQHVLVMYSGAVAVPLIVASGLHLSRADTAFMVSADLFCCGLATVLQSWGLAGLGIRLPVVMAATFASAGPMIAIGSDPGLGLGYVFGGHLVAGAAGLLLAPLIGRLLRFFPPLVTGTVIASIGLTLLGVAVNWAAGGAGASDYASLPHLELAGMVLLLILVMVRYGRGFVANIGVLLGMVAGMVAAAMMGIIDWQGLSTAPWVSAVVPFHFGRPRFDPWSILTMCIVLCIVFVESTGMFLALGEIVGRPVQRRDLVRGLRVDALGTLLGGIFNAFPDTSYSQNIGLVSLTGVRSRWVCVLSGFMLIGLGLMPKLAVLVAAIPPSVLGGAGLVMFGLVTAHGLRVLARVDFQARPHNLLIVAVSLGLAMIPVVSSHFFDHLPSTLAPLLHSGIVLATLAAVGMNAWFNGPDDIVGGPVDPASNPERPLP
ncbi:nucleobase:cation symporter-2 family protein [Frateuria aurantia]